MNKYFPNNPYTRTLGTYLLENILNSSLNIKKCDFHHRVIRNIFLLTTLLLGIRCERPNTENELNQEKINIPKIQGSLSSISKEIIQKDRSQIEDKNNVNGRYANIFKLLAIYCDDLYETSKLKIIEKRRKKGEQYNADKNTLSQIELLKKYEIDPIVASGYFHGWEKSKIYKGNGGELKDISNNPVETNNLLYLIHNMYIFGYTLRQDEGRILQGKGSKEVFDLLKSFNGEKDNASVVDTFKSYLNTLLIKKPIKIITNNKEVEFKHILDLTSSNGTSIDEKIADKLSSNKLYQAPKKFLISLKENKNAELKNIYSFSIKKNNLEESVSDIKYSLKYALLDNGDLYYHIDQQTFRKSSNNGEDDPIFLNVAIQEIINYNGSCILGYETSN